MTGPKVSWGFVSNTMAALIAAVVGAMLLKYGDLPVRVSVVETKVDDLRADQKDIKDTVHMIFQRLNHR